MRTHSALLLSLLLACRAAPDRASASDVSQGSGGDARLNDEKAIRDAESRWRKILASHDTALIRTFYTEDGIYAPQGSPAYRGRDSVSRRWAGEFLSPGFELERTPMRIEVAKSGDLANETGTYLVHYLDKGKRMEARGTYMTAWRKLDGGWKIASYMWNRNEPEGQR
jgi:ketosteroid isomerase-like protein